MSRRELLMGGTQEIMYFLNEQWWVVNPVSTTRILCGTCKYYVCGVVCQPPTLEKHQAFSFIITGDLWMTSHCGQVNRDFYETVSPKWLQIFINLSAALETDIQTRLHYWQTSVHCPMWSCVCFMEWKAYTSRNAGILTISVQNLCLESPQI